MADRQIAGGVNNASDYLDRLFKLIPAEVTAAFVAVQTLLTNPDAPNQNFWILAAFGAFLTFITPFYLRRLQNVTNLYQLMATTISFPIWAANIAVAQVTVEFDWISPQLLTVVMIGWVLLIPLVVPARR